MDGGKQNSNIKIIEDRNSFENSRQSRFSGGKTATDIFMNAFNNTNKKLQEPQQQQRLLMPPQTTYYNSNKDQTGRKEKYSTRLDEYLKT